MDISTESQKKLEQIMNADVHDLPDHLARINLVDLQGIALEYRNVVSIQNSIIASNPKTKANATGTDFPVLDDPADQDAVRDYSLQLLDWQAQHGAPGMDHLAAQAHAMYPDYAAREALRPKANATGNVKEIQSRDPSKVLNFNKYTGMPEEI